MGLLARLLAVSTDLTDEEARIDLSAYGPKPPAPMPVATQFEEGGDLIETGRDGPAVVVIGDSFTRGYWQDYFALHAGRYRLDAPRAVRVRGQRTLVQRVARGASTGAMTCPSFCA